MTDAATTHDPAVPPGERPLPRDYWRLFTAASISNLGDGIDAAALPLVAAALTRDPLLFAGIAVVNRLPWLLFTLHAGAIADRVDRKRMMVAMNLVRALLFGALGVAIVGGWASIWLLYVITFLTGVAEVLFDTSWQPILPAVVDHPDQLERANGRLFGAQTVLDQFVGPPVGGFLFGLGAAVPIFFDAGTFLIAAGIIAAMAGSYVARRPAPTPQVELSVDPDTPPSPSPETAGEATARPRLRDDIREGLVWLREHRLLRGLALLLGAMNGLSSMAFAIFALFALDVLGVSELGFGVLLTAVAVGSVLGSVTAERLVARIGRAGALWIALVAAVVIPAAQGTTSDAVVFGALSVGFGYAAVVWNVVTVSLRQTIIPDHLLGRVNAVYRFIGWGSMPLGALAGGAIANAFGLRMPFFVAGGAMLLTLLPASRVVTARAIEEARAAAGAR